MVEDKIMLALKDIAKTKEEIRDIKKDMRAQEKVDNEQYTQLKTSLKELKAQIKDMEEDWKEDLKKDDYYNKLREMLQNKEEDFAKISGELFTAVSSLPAKPVIMKMDTEEGPVNIQIQPEMKVYVNGKEEKKRA
ncbi:hypothetical protein GF354_00845 [Candidatus Peregrinibacteria bacterium]|nr:hypothetical protein [Candidatus Peregrinibacteria bacterium]